MDIEKELRNLSQEARELPPQLNMERIVRKTKRRKTIHTISFAGRSVLSVAAGLFILLFIGVNSSVSIARAFTEMPLIGGLSESLVIRRDIRQVIRNREDIGEVIGAGGLHEVSMTKEGKNSDLSFTIDSYLADESSFSAFVRLDGELPSDFAYLEITNISINDTDRVKPVEYYNSGMYKDIRIGELQFMQFFWERPSTDFVIGFDIIVYRFNSEPLEESFNFKFEDVEIPEAKYVPINQIFNLEGYEILFTEMIIAQSSTKIIYEDPSIYGIDFYGFDIYLTDSDGHVLSDATEYNSYSFMEGRKNYTCVILPTVYYKETEDIQINIAGASFSRYDERILSVNIRHKMASFDGRTIPVEVYERSTYEDFGLPADPDLYGIESIVIFVPYDDSMPFFNAPYEIFDDMNIYKNKYDYPITTIDGQDYMVIQCPVYFESNDVYHFVAISDSKKARYRTTIDVDIEG
ncbi:MAG: hypothetical protein J5379_06485 [Clostridiales bacterium]|nr:hypothetical protein [Clostridiales bacterium]